MLDLGFYEKVIQPPTKKKSTASKIIATVIYIALVGFLILTMIISGMFVPGFIAIVILSLALYLFFGTASYEYEYSFSDAGVTLAKIYAKKRRKTIFDLSDEQILLIAPANEQNLARAEELAASIPNSWIPSQFDNPANPHAHYLTTGPEIYEDTEGKVDVFVAGVGTGGTFSGTAAYLKEQNPNIKIIAVEPQGSPYLSEGRGGAHKIQGIGAGFIPGTLDTSIYDEIITVSDSDAMDAARDVAKTDGLLVGISSGAALAAAKIAAKRPENEGKSIVVILPDTGERYLSSELFN